MEMTASEQCRSAFLHRWSPYQTQRLPRCDRSENRIRPPGNWALTVILMRNALEALNRTELLRVAILWAGIALAIAGNSHHTRQVWHRGQVRFLQTFELSELEMAHLGLPISSVSSLVAWRDVPVWIPPFVLPLGLAASSLLCFTRHTCRVSFTNTNNIRPARLSWLPAPCI